MKNVKALVARGRAAAEHLMLDSCQIKRPVVPTTDRTTGAVSDGYAPDAIYSGKCKLQSYTNRTIDPVSGDHRFTIQHCTLDIPISAVGINIGDVLVITDAALDPDLANRKFRITGLSNKSIATARRLNAEEITG